MKLETTAGDVRALLIFIATGCLLLFTACGSEGTATVNNGSAVPVNSPPPMAPPANADKAAPTGSPQIQSKAMPVAANSPNAKIGSGGNDFFLFTKSRSALESDADLKTANITVDVKDGVVTLSGSVANADLKSKAEQLVRETSGVKEVKSRIRIGK